MKIVIFFNFILVSSICLGAEVSVFSAGNLNVDEPYGLTSTEKYILKNKKDLNFLDKKVKNVKSHIQELNKRIDGLSSIYEGESQRLNSTLFKLEDIDNNLKINVEKRDLNTKEIHSLKNVVNQVLLMQKDFESQNKKNINTLKKAISELTILVNKINSDYVTSKEFKSNMSQFVTLQEYKFGKTSKKEDEKLLKNNTFSSKSKEELLLEARLLFKQDYFTKALPILYYLDKEKYELGEINYLLGEIHFYRKKYKKAINYFKKSALLNDKVEYMPKLLLHSALSFEKIRDLDNAKSFYNTIMELYPNSYESNISKDKLLTI